MRARINASLLRTQKAGANQNDLVLKNGKIKMIASQMKVYFGKKKAVLVRSNGSSILGLVPKLNAGKQQVSVVCGTDSVVGDGVLFKYEQTKSVKTLAGVFGDEKNQDGDLNSARFKEVSNIATVKGNNSDNIIAVESWWNSRVSLVSPEDNQVVTLSTSHSFGTPAVDNTREKFYLVQHWADDRVVYSYSRTENYAEKNTGINISKNDMNGQIWSGAFRENDDNHLYYLDTNCNFCEVDLEGSAVLMAAVLITGLVVIGSIEKAKLKEAGIG